MLISYNNSVVDRQCIKIVNSVGNLSAKEL